MNTSLQKPRTRPALWLDCLQCGHRTLITITIRLSGCAAQGFICEQCHAAYTISVRATPPPEPERIDYDGSLHAFREKLERVKP